MFYWDYDLLYTKQIVKHEAGEFINRNLKLCPNELPRKLFRHSAEAEEHTLYLASTENAQAPFFRNGYKVLFPLPTKKRERRSPLQRSPAASRTALHPAGSEER